MPTRNELVPQRQPSVPPVEIRAQKDVGFAKFLKKHSSPTHQRVTAGGRIVPMEKRAPPTFSLKEHKSDELGNEKYRKSQEPVVKGTQPALLSHEEPEGASTHRNHVTGHLMPSIETPANWINGIAPSQQSTLYPVAGDLHYPGLVTASDPTPFPLVLPTYPGMLILQPELQLFNGVQSSLPAAVQYPYTPAPWLYPHMAGLQIGDHATVVDPLAFYRQDLQELLVQQTALFEDLDHQLKLMDRHRAMSALDPYLVEQRKAVVQQRAEAKEQISNLKAQLDGKAGHTTYEPVPVTTAPTSAGLNVEAPAYIPTASSQPASGAKAEVVVPFQKVEGNTSTSSSGPTVEKPKRKPLRIRPPPPFSPQNTTRLTKSAPITEVSENHDNKHTDDWGVQIGSAPVSIKKEQSVLSDSLSGSDGEISPNVNLSSTAQMANPFYDQGDLKSGEERRSESMRSEASATSPSWSENDDRQIPASIEAFYEQQLDALRMPRGTTTCVQLGEGTVIEVPGQNLQPPSPEKISSFEKRYWQSKFLQPIVDDGSKSNEYGNGPARRQVSPIIGMCTTQEQNVNIPASFFTTTNEANALAALHGVVYKTQAAKDAFTQTSSSLEEGSRFEKPSEHMSWLEPVQASLPSRFHGDSAGLSSADRKQFAWNEALNHKGHSSVFLERRHALAPFPPSIDGSREASRLSAHKLLVRSQPPSSPTLIHKKIGDSIAWYGPYHREARGMGMRYQVGSTAVSRF